MLISERPNTLQISENFSPQPRKRRKLKGEFQRHRRVAFFRRGRFTVTLPREIFLGSTLYEVNSLTAVSTQESRIPKALITHVIQWRHF